MKETFKTVAFVIVALVLAGSALLTELISRPRSKGDDLVGKPFYENFDSSAKSASLEVVAIDPETMSRQQFSVRNDKGTWKIPSHHNYPADAAARLAQTSTSVMGVVRESLAGGASEHERLGVIDPKEAEDKEIDDPTSIGKRITLLDADGEIQVDYIIGKSAGEVPRTNLDPNMQTNDKPLMYYYVRRADESQVYKTVLDIDLSTKFSDWIDSDLLRIEPDKISRMKIDNYKLTEERGGVFGQVKSLFKEQGDQIELSRPSSVDPWVYTELQREKEELNKGKIIMTMEILSDLAIVGVRPKFKFKNQLLLTQDLQFNRIPELEQNIQEAREAIEEFQSELEDRGFTLAGSQEKLELASTRGRFEVGTNEGVRYTLEIGNEVEGSEKEIEIGGAKVVKAEAPEATEKKADDGSQPELQKKSENKNSEKNRYVMIRVSFDEKLIGPRPVKPEPPQEPKKPEGYVEPPAAPEKSEPESTEAKPDESEKPPTPERDPEFVRYDELIKTYEKDKVEYEIALSGFESDSKKFDEQVDAGKKLVDELNQRFGDWYYVIKGSNLEAIQMNREDIVQPLKEAPPRPTGGLPTTPNIEFPDVEGNKRSGVDQAPASSEKSNPAETNDRPQTDSTTTGEKAPSGEKVPESSSENPAKTEDETPANTEDEKKPVNPDPEAKKELKNE